MTTLSEVQPGDVLEYGAYGPCVVESVRSFDGGWNGKVPLVHIRFTSGLGFTAHADRPAGIVAPIWECYGCGAWRQSLDKGFNTTCDECGSYELHLTDAAKRSLR